MPTPPRFVQASSIAVYGARNPHRGDSLLTASTPLHPTDLYGQHKALAEQCVTSSDLDWVVLRLGGVLTAQPRFEIDRDLVFFEAVLPCDGRIHTVDVRDVAHAFSAATRTDRVREVFLIGGDRTHRITQARIGVEYAAAMGLPGAIPPGRPGDPDDDLSWYATDWIDTEPAQKVLAFQHHSLPQPAGRDACQGGLAAVPVAARRSAGALVPAAEVPYRGFPGATADPMRAIARRFGDPAPSESADSVSLRP